MSNTSKGKLEDVHQSLVSIDNKTVDNSQGIIDVNSTLTSIDTKTIDNTQEFEDMNTTLTTIDAILDSIDLQLEGFTEEVTGGVNIINSDHALIHLGMSYCAHLEYASLAPLAKKVYRIRSPLTLYVHIKNIFLSVEGATCRVSLKRNCTITNNGVELTNVLNNLNDNSNNTPQSKFYDSNVAYTGGTIWCSTIVHADTSGAGGSTSRSSSQFIQGDYQEYITKNNNTDYILEIENISTIDTALNLHISIIMYEENQGLVSL